MLKKIAIAVGLLTLYLYALLSIFLKNPVFTSTQDLNLANSKILKDNLFHIVGEFTPRSFSNIHNLNKTADFIISKLNEHEIKSKIQTFKVIEDIDERYKKHDEYKGYDSLKDEIEANTYKNIVVKFGPENTPKYIVGAHYDIANNLPGADDNTSGTVGLLELARILKKNESQLKNQVELVFYSLEEPPFFRSKNMGSYYHAQSVKGDKIKLMISVEMIGYFTDKPNSQKFPLSILKYFFTHKGNFIAIIGRVEDWMLTRNIKSKFITGSSLSIRSLNAPAKLVGIDFSDHLNYWDIGVPALMITDSAFYRNTQYHKSGDTPDRLDYEKMAKVVDGIYSIVTTP